MFPRRLALRCADVHSGAFHYVTPKVVALGAARPLKLALEGTPLGVNLRVTSESVPAISVLYGPLVLLCAVRMIFEAVVSLKRQHSCYECRDISPS